MTHQHVKLGLLAVWLLGTISCGSSNLFGTGDKASGNAGSPAPTPQGLPVAGDTTSASGAGSATETLPEITPDLLKQTAAAFLSHLGSGSGGGGSGGSVNIAINVNVIAPADLDNITGTLSGFLASMLTANPGVLGKADAASIGGLLTSFVQASAGKDAGGAAGSANGLIQLVSGLMKGHPASAPGGKGGGLVVVPIIGGAPHPAPVIPGPPGPHPGLGLVGSTSTGVTLPTGTAGSSLGTIVSLVQDILSLYSAISSSNIGNIITAGEATIKDIFSLVSAFSSTSAAATPPATT